MLAVLISQVKTSCEMTEFHIPICKLSVHKRYMYKESTLTSIFKV